MKTSIIIIGAGGHAISVTNVAISNGMSVIAYVDDNKAGIEIMGTPVITKKQCFETCSNNNFAIAIGDNAERERVRTEYFESLPNACFPSLIHASSVIGFGTIIGDGAIVMPLVNLGPNSKIGEFCILNTISSIDHDCTMKSYSSLAPRVACGGNVKIGFRSAISIGATVKHGVTLGNDVVIGANSYVNKIVEDNILAYGTPCNSIRVRRKGDPYLS